MDASKTITSRHFNSQPHKEADRNQCIDEITGEVFQLTASQGGWHDTISPYFRHDAFQLTASQGGWPRMYREIIENSEFQLTASQGGWLSGDSLYSGFVSISTHSLTRRLTVFYFIHWAIKIFQLTASQGGWPDSINSLIQALAFQLTASQGGWRRNLIRTVALFLHFNSQPHKEADDFH